jgi:hypothetical protein
MTGKHYMELWSSETTNTESTEEAEDEKTYNNTEEINQKELETVIRKAKYRVQIG